MPASRPPDQDGGNVHLEEGPKIAVIELSTEAVVPRISDADFRKYAEKAKNDCPVSKALAGPNDHAHAKLLPA